VIIPDSFTPTSIDDISALVSTCSEERRVNEIAECKEEAALMIEVTHRGRATLYVQV
jgi:hypothetical protein